MAFANRQLGQETPRAGWMTDRGRTYIQLDEPQEVQRFVAPRAFWPMELWTYAVDPIGTALPAFFYTLFFRPQQSQEFRLYDPFADGPEQLAKQITLQLREPVQIIEHLRVSLSAELAHTAVNMNLSEPTDFRDPRPSAGNAFVQRGIAEAPYRRVDAAYATRFFANRGSAESVVAFDRVPVDFAAYGFWDSRGIPFIHYAVQISPQRVLLGQYEDDYYVSLGVDLTITDLRKTEVETVSQNVEQHFDEAKKDEVIRAPLAWFDRVDMIPGVYDVSLTFVNKVADERAVESVRVRVPTVPEGGWAMSELLLARAAVPARTPPTETGPRAFRFGDSQLVLSVDGIVGNRGQLLVLAQVVPDLAAAVAPTIMATVTLVDESGVGRSTVYTTDLPTQPAPSPTDLRVELPLNGVEPGAYKVRLSARVGNGQELSVEAPITVVESGREPRTPEILLGGDAAPGDVSEYRARALQHARVGQGELARAYLVAGLQRTPGSPDLLRSLAQLALDEEDFDASIDALTRLRGSDGAGPADILNLSRALRGVGRAEEASPLVRQLVAARPTAVAWKELAAILEALGEPANAAAAYRASLQLDPEQPDVRAALELLAKLDVSSH